MKKTLAITAAFLLSCTAMSVMPTAAEGDSTSVYVTISDKDGKLAVAQEKIDVTDIDSDGALTINDVFYIAHEKFYEGGAAEGYKSSTGTYGLAVDKLWGAENGGSYGYYVNSKAANGLADTIKDGDYVDGFVYTDLSAWSDAYSWFDVRTGETDKDGELTFKLSRAAFDENYAPVTLPVEGAVITLNGEDTEYVTDAEGAVTVKFEKAGKTLVSAKSDSLTLVPPVSIVEVAGEEEEAVTTTTQAPAAASTTTTTAASKTTTTTTKAASTTTTKAAAASNAPATGDKGTGIAAALLGVSAAAALSLRKRHED